jgi:hypothetical protein
MSPLMDQLAPVLLYGGLAGIAYGLFPVLGIIYRSGVRLIPTVIGGSAIAVSMSVGDATPIAPGPVGPVPGPVSPLSDFGTALRASIQQSAGTKREVEILAACHRGMSRALRRDGTKQTPAVKNTNEMGAAFADLQRYYAGSEALFGPKFDPFDKVCRDVALQRGIIGTTGLPMDPSLRQKAVDYYAEIASTLTAIAAGM